MTGQLSQAASKKEGCKTQDCYVIINGNKYNLKGFHHPFRSLSFIQEGDVTAIFQHSHSGAHEQKLEKLSPFLASGSSSEKQANSGVDVLDLNLGDFFRQARHFDDLTKNLYQKSLYVKSDSAFRQMVDDEAHHFLEIIKQLEDEALATDRLEDLHADLAFIGGRYRGALRKKPLTYLPEPLSTLWLKVSAALGRHPIVEYADVVSHNTVFSPSDNHEDNCQGPRSLEVLRHFSGTEDEENFYKQHAYAEVIFYSEFYPLIKRFHQLNNSCDLSEMSQTLKDMHAALSKVSKHAFEPFAQVIDRHMFFFYLRKFFGSVKDLHFEGHGPLDLGGASGAQSSIFCVLDALIELPDADEPLKATLERFNSHRPLVQRCAIAEIREKYGLRTPCIESITGYCDQEDKVKLLKAFNQLVQEYATLRRNHETLIRQYIMEFISPANKEEGDGCAMADAKPVLGTGGTPLDLMMSRTSQIIMQMISVPELGVDPHKDLVAQETKQAEVNPYFVKGRVDYNRLCEQFGCQMIGAELLESLLELFKKRSGGTVTTLHPLLERGIFYTHRDLEKLVDHLQDPEAEVYIYTGRGPSGGMHMGHLLPFQFTNWLQKALNAQVVIQMTDDEKYAYRNMSLEQVESAMAENVRDIIAVGFDPEKTFIFSDFQYVGVMYPLITSISRAVTTNQIKGLFGFGMSTSVGIFHFPCIQAAPSFSRAFPHLFPDPSKKILCLIPQAIDQDVYFRMTRDVAPVLGLEKPILIHSKFFPALQGPDSKMSSSDPNSAIFLTDSPEVVSTKIRKHAYSGGQSTRQLQEQLGADIDVDVAYQFLVHFDHDSERVRKVGEEYAAGKLLSGQVKNMAIELINNVIRKHQANLSKITQEDVDAFMAFPYATRSSAI